MIPAPQPTFSGENADQKAISFFAFCLLLLGEFRADLGQGIDTNTFTRSKGEILSFYVLKRRSY